MDWYGNETLHNTPFTNMTIQGTPVAAIQNVDQFSFAWVFTLERFRGRRSLTLSQTSRVYQAGHEVVSIISPTFMMPINDGCFPNSLHSSPKLRLRYFHRFSRGSNCIPFLDSYPAHYSLYVKRIELKGTWQIAKNYRSQLWLVHAQRT